MTGVVNIQGEIGVDVKIIDVIHQVERQKEATKFVVNLNSVGGYVEEGFAIYKYLKDLEQPITMNGVGVIASIASVIFLAGDNRRVQNGTEFMIHLPSLSDPSYNTAEDFEMIAKEMRKIENRVIKFYEQNTSLKGDTLRTLLKNETFLTPEQLYDFGFTTAKHSLRAVAKLNINKSKKEMTKEELENKKAKSILAKIKAFFADEAVMKDLKTADQRTLNFAEVEDAENVKVGDKATVDGAAANGDYVMADGRTFTFENGTLTAIIEAEEEPDLEAEIANLKAENERLKNEAEAKKQETADAVAKLEEAKKTLKDIESIQSKVVAKKKPTEKTKSPLSGAFDNLRKN